MNALIDSVFESPVFETERLVAGTWSPEFAEMAFELYGDPDVTRFIGGETDKDVDATRIKIVKYMERNARWPEKWSSWPVFLRSSRQLIGNAMRKPLPGTDGIDTQDIEIGWHLAKSVWGKGFASEFGNVLIRDGFERHSEQALFAVVDLENDSSKKVALRLGMQHVGTTNKYYTGQTIDVFRIDRHQYS